MKRVLLKKKILKKNSKYGLHTPPPPHFDFYFLNLSSATFFKIKLKIWNNILHAFYLNIYYSQSSQQI
jgi:hypothetical protein